ncbi:MAG: hypothetical protein M1823_004062 [Watsoniomyces obsoletus]|nr:MAG: hypothetical protein M1823_004062 [Watsoniomyces obsoletus]
MSNNPGFIFPPPPPPPPRASGPGPGLSFQNTGPRNGPSFTRGRGPRGAHSHTPGNNSRGRGWQQNNRYPRGAGHSHSSSRGNSNNSGGFYPSTNVQSQGYGYFAQNEYSRRQISNRLDNGSRSTTNGFPQRPIPPETSNGAPVLPINLRGMMMQAMQQAMATRTGNLMSGDNVHPGYLNPPAQQMPSVVDGVAQQTWGSHMSGQQQQQQQLRGSLSTNGPQMMASSMTNGLEEAWRAVWSARNSQYQSGNGSRAVNHTEYSRGPPRGGFDNNNNNRQQQFQRGHYRPQSTRPVNGYDVVAPAVPSFSAIPLPPNPSTTTKPAVDSSSDERDKKKQKLNLFGLTPRVVDPKSSDDDDENEEVEIDEEKALSQQITSLAGTHLRIEYKGQISTLNTQADIKAWITERRNRYPTKQRVKEKKEERERRIEEVKRRRDEEEREQREKRNREREREREETEQGGVDKEIIPPETTKGNQEQRQSKDTSKQQHQGGKQQNSKKGKGNPAEQASSTRGRKRKGLYQRMLELDHQKEDELVLDAVRYLGDRGVFNMADDGKKG